MTERVELWWARRQFSKGLAVPYPVGTYRDAWAPYPALIRQYHPDLNAGVALTQIPPAADVLLCWECDAGHRFAATPAEQRDRPGRRRRRSAWCPECSALALPPRMTAATRGRATPASRGLCEKTPHLPPGTPFRSECAPKPASAVEARLSQGVFARLAVTRGLTAVRTRRPLFEHLEVWPDILLPELRVAVEYDSVGRFGLEHVGRREQSDRRKDRLLRETGWEVVRLRTGKLETLGPHDLQVASVGRGTVDRLIDVVRSIRGDLIVDAYTR